MLVPISQRSSAAAGISPGASPERASSVGKETTIGWGVLGVLRPRVPSSGSAAAGFPTSCSSPGSTGMSGWQSWLFFLHASRDAASKIAAFPVDPTFCSRWHLLNLL